MQSATRPGVGPVWTRIELTTPASEVELLIPAHTHTPNRCSTTSSLTHEAGSDATCVQSEELTLDATHVSAREPSAGWNDTRANETPSTDVCGCVRVAVEPSGAAAVEPAGAAAGGVPVAPACATDACGREAERTAATSPLEAFVISGEQLDVYSTGTSPLGFSVFALTDGYKLSDGDPLTDVHDLSRMWAGRSWCDAATFRLRPGEGGLSAAQRAASRTRPRVIIHPRSHSRAARDLDGRRVRMYAGSDVVCDVQLVRNVTVLPAYSNGSSCSGSACPAWIVPLDNDHVCSSGVRWRDPCERFTLRGAAFAEPDACEVNSSCEAIVLPDQPSRHGSAALRNPGKPPQWCDVIMDRFNGRAPSPACNATLQLQDGFAQRHTAHLVLQEAQSAASSPLACLLLDAAPSAPTCLPVSSDANEGEVRLSFPGHTARGFIVSGFNTHSATELPAWRAEFALPWDASVVDVAAASTMSSACRVRYKCLAPRAGPSSAERISADVDADVLARPSSSPVIEQVTPRLPATAYVDELTVLVGSLPVVLLLLFLFRQWLQRPAVSVNKLAAIEKEAAHEGIQAGTQPRAADSQRKVLKPSPSLRIISRGAGPLAPLSGRQTFAHSVGGSASSTPHSDAESVAPNQRSLRKTASIREYAAGTLDPSCDDVHRTTGGFKADMSVSTTSTRARRAEVPQRRLSFASPTLRSARPPDSDEA